MSSLSIPITGISSTYRVPGNYAEPVFAQGPSTSSSGPRKVLITGAKTSSGTWTAGTMYRVTSDSVASDGAGSGSPLHRAARAFLAANRTAEVYALPYAVSSGTGASAAIGTITIAGSPTSAGMLEVMICGETITLSVGTSDTATTLGDDLAGAINAKVWLPVTAVNTTGTVVITAKVVGISQNAANAGIRYRCRVISGTGVTITASSSLVGDGSTGATSGADGTTTEIANLTAALAASALTNKYYYNVLANNVSGAVAAYKSHIATKALPVNGLRECVVVGSNVALATAITHANAANYERVRYVWQPSSEHDAAELAGYMAAVYQAGESTDPGKNWDGYSGPDFLIQGTYSSASWPTNADVNDAINNGLTPIASNASGAYVVMSVTSRSKNSNGTIDDFRACESHRVSIVDAFTDDLILRITNNFGGQKLRDDQTDSKGAVNPNQVVPRGVITPSRMKPAIRKLIDEYDSLGLLQDTDASKSSLLVIKSPTNSGRVEAQLDLRTTDLYHQGTFRIAEVSPG